MDILYLGTLPPHPGGSAIVADQVLPRLAARGHRVRAVSGSTLPIAEQEAIDRSALPGLETFRYPVPAHEVDTSRITLQVTREEAPWLRAAIRRAIAHACPEVVVCGRASYALHAAPIARALRVPMVQIQHSRGGGSLEPNDPVRARWVRDRLDRAAITILVAENLREVHGGGRSPMVVARNAVETDRFRPMPRDPALAARLGIPADAVVVMHPSNLKPVKRATDLMAAIPAVLARVPGVRFLFVGDGQDRAALERTVRDAGLDELVCFVGWRSRAEMPAWYALADIVAMPSQTEAMPLAGLETMAAGRVLVATDIPGFREALTDGHDGLLVPVGDVAALADRIASVASDADLRARLGANARITSLRWSVDEVVTGWEAAIASVIPTRATAGAGTSA